MNAMQRHFDLIGKTKMKKNTIRIKLQCGPNGLPVSLENALQDFGFSCHSRKIGKWVIYEKDLVPYPKNKDLDRKTIEALDKRLNKIVDIYLDPYSNTEAIRAQALTLADSLPKAEQDYVLDWIERVVEGEDFYGNGGSSNSNDPPWESMDNFDWQTQGTC